MFFLKDRDVLEISNFDDKIQIKNFLQSIISNDIKLIENENFDSESHSIYTLFLNSNGRFLFDAFIVIPFEGQNSIFIDCNSLISDELISHIKKYKMRLEFEIKKRDDLCIYAGEKNSQDEGVYFSYNDTRWASKTQKRFVFLSEPAHKKQIENSSFDDYHRFRILNFIIDGHLDMQSNLSFPIHYNMHNQNAISLNKGCYIGQETTNRLFRTGVLRKKLFVVRFSKESKNSGNKNDILYKLNEGEFQKCGLICSAYVGDLALFLIDLSDDLEFTKSEGCKENIFELYVNLNSKLQEQDEKELKQDFQRINFSIVI